MIRFVYIVIFFLLGNIARADICPDLNGNFLACVSSMPEDDQAKEFLIHQEAAQFEIDSVGHDGKIVQGIPFQADNKIVQLAGSTLQSSCSNGALVQNIAIFMNGTPFFSFIARYSLSDTEHLQLDLFMDVAANAPTKTIRCVRFR